MATTTAAHHWWDNFSGAGLLTQVALECSEIAIVYLQTGQKFHAGLTFFNEMLFTKT